MSYPLRLLSVLAVAAMLVLLAAPPRTAAAQGADDGCDPAEPIACLPLPIDEDGSPADGGGSAPSSGPASAAAPRAPLPPAPYPCPPYLTGAEPAAAAPAPRPLPEPTYCYRRDIVASVNRANALYARALRTWDAGILPQAWSGPALADLRGQINALRSRGAYATPRLYSIALVDLYSDGRTAWVRTIEHWRYEERARFDGRLLYADTQWVENIYEMGRGGAGWVVVRNEIRSVDPGYPYPPPPIPLPLPR